MLVALVASGECALAQTFPIIGFAGPSAGTLRQTYSNATSSPVYERPSSSSGSRLSLGATPTVRSKPFQSYTPAPAVSPYLNLFREDLNGQRDFNYNTLVRPMLQQQQVNQQFQQQSAEMSRRLQSLAARPKFNPQGSETQAPTGHQTVFMYTGRYFPAPNGVAQQ
jgi:hypothetical protein